MSAKRRHACKGAAYTSQLLFLFFSFQTTPYDKQLVRKYEYRHAQDKKLQFLGEEFRQREVSGA
eukprot:1029343-Pelagomonas_calceolata.AAC.1